MRTTPQDGSSVWYFVAMIFPDTIPCSAHCSSAAVMRPPKLFGPGPPPQCCMLGTMKRRMNPPVLPTHLRYDVFVVVYGVGWCQRSVGPAMVNNQLSASLLGNQCTQLRFVSFGGTMQKPTTHLRFTLDDT